MLSFLRKKENMTQSPPSSPKNKPPSSPKDSQPKNNPPSDSQHPRSSSSTPEQPASTTGQDASATKQTASSSGKRCFLSTSGTHRLPLILSSGFTPKEQATSASHEEQASATKQEQGSKLIAKLSRKYGLKDTPTRHAQSDAPLARTDRPPPFLSSGVAAKERKIDMVERDMISELPNTILQGILSRLPTKEAVRTSSLSTKWESLWTELPSFHFEVFNPPCKSSRRKQNLVRSLKHSIGRLLNRKNKIEKLHISIEEVTISPSTVTWLLSSVLNHNIVNSLHLKIDNFKDLDTRVVIPSSIPISYSLTKLVLNLKFILVVRQGIRLPGLKKLKLSYLRFSNEYSAQNLLDGCPFLEALTIYRCSWNFMYHLYIGISTLKRLTIESHSPRVIHDKRDLCDFQIDAENLLELNLSSTPVLSFKPVNMRSLTHASVDLENTSYSPIGPSASDSVHQLLTGIAAQVKDLFITCETIMCLHLSALESLPLMHNLTQLCIRTENKEFFTIGLLMSFLQKLPKLQRIQMPMVFFIDLEDDHIAIDPIPPCFMTCLEVLSISKFGGYRAEVQFLKLVLQIGTLKELNITCSLHLQADLDKITEINSELSPLAVGRCAINWIAYC